MTNRTTWSTVTFQRPFGLSALEELQPAGTYQLEIEEEELSGLSFIAYRRIATHLHTPEITNERGRHEVIPISSDELATVLASDYVTIR